MAEPKNAPFDYAVWRLGQHMGFGPDEEEWPEGKRAELAEQVRAVIYGLIEGVQDDYESDAMWLPLVTLFTQDAETHDRDGIVAAVLRGALVDDGDPLIEEMRASDAPAALINERVNP